MNQVLLLVVGLGLVSSAAVDSNKTQTAVPEMRITPSSGSFLNGFNTCRSWGMWPLSVHNEATEVAAWNMCAASTGNCYFGLRRSTNNNGPAWFYDDGSVYDYTAWDAGQPGASETVVTMYVPGRTATRSWHDWGTGADSHPMLCGNGAASESPMPSTSPVASLTRSSSPSVSPASSATASASMSVSNTPGVCRTYCVGQFGLCQNPVWEDFTCYPFDNAGNCPVNTVSCPSVIEADTVHLCQSCAMETSGSCQHPVDGICAEHLDGGVCPPGYTFCGAFF